MCPGGQGPSPTVLGAQVSAKALVEQRDRLQSDLEGKDRELEALHIRLTEAETWATGARQVELQNQSHMQQRLYMEQV